ncbi:MULTISPECIES: glycosyltransferase [unclassified Sphingomonas]|uniref:glycosyltransferase n=1 Tax=unclassified Sphingomonas TaxID=196159 RepID=UPI002269A9C7|nr:MULTISPECIES: glycosyltransferase [unclassified Sphingomonas]
MLRVLTLSTLFPDATRPNFGVFVERQTAALAALPGVAVTVVAPIGMPLWPLSRGARHAALGRLPLRERWHGLDVHRPRFAALPFTGGRFHARAMERAIVPVLDALAFDVIDASFFFPDGVAAVRLGRRYGVPVSIKARGADVHHWGRAPATARQVAQAGQGADGLLAVSAAMRGDMIALGMPAEAIRVHRTGVDHARFGAVDRTVARAALGVTGPLIVAVGALIPRKGHDVVIDAVARLPGVALWIAGEGPERGRLEAHIARAGIGDRVQLLGGVAHDDLPRLLAAADVMALASASEGLANAWVEALAAGTPIVVTDAGGARELLSDEQAGRVVARDPAAFAAAIADLLRAPPCTQAVKAAAAGYSWATNAAGLHAHLAGLVAARQSG